MENLEGMIKNLLKDEDQYILSETEELGYFALAMSIFRGKTGWVSWVIMFAQTFIFIASVWCAMKFYAATEVLLAVKWGISAGVLLLAAMMTKLSLMPVMQASRILRELKRVELLLARTDS